MENIRTFMGKSCLHALFVFGCFFSIANFTWALFLFLPDMQQLELFIFSSSAGFAISIFSLLLILCSSIDIKSINASLFKAMLSLSLFVKLLLLISVAITISACIPFLFWSLTLSPIYFAPFSIVSAYIIIFIAFMIFFKFADNTDLLHKAIHENNISLVNSLIAAGDDVNKYSKDHQTPLYIAVTCINIDIVNILIAADADLNQPDSNGSTPISLALLLSNDEICEILNNHHAECPSEQQLSLIDSIQTANDTVVSPDNNSNDNNSIESATNSESIPSITL